MTNIALIDGHPDADRGRFVHALADAYASGAASAGHPLRRIELATLDFPLLRSSIDWREQAPCATIAQAQETIRWAEHIVFLYPLWLGYMPALLKAFLEQVARPGFALEEGGMPKPLLGGRSARLVVTMGMPSFFYRFYYGAHSVRSFERNILNLAGVKPVANTLIGNVEGDAADRAAALEKLYELGGKAS